ncbi:MAG: histidinol-phosphatase [Pseudomonadota bacterium]
MPSNTDTHITVAHALADAADRETLKWFRADHLISDNKSTDGFDPVTQADRAAEQAMRGVLAVMRPHDGILGEEQATTPGTSGLTWVLDPIDGTRGFLCGTPTWGTLIAVGPDVGPVAGMISQPFTGERFYGDASGAFLRRAGQHTPIHVRGTVHSLRDALIFTTFPEVGTQAEARAFHAVAAQCKQTRYGMDCYAYALLAAGHIDLVIEAGLHPYDIQGPMAVVQAAGGVVTDWQGGPAHQGGQVIAAANPALHAAAIAILQDNLHG